MVNSELGSSTLDIDWEAVIEEIESAEAEKEQLEDQKEEDKEIQEKLSRAAMTNSRD